MQLKFFARASMGYYDGLTGTSTDQTGNVPTQGSLVSSVGVGVFGSRERPRDSIIGALRLNYSHYSRENSFNGLNGVASIGYHRQVSPHWTLFTFGSAVSQATVLGVEQETFTGSPLNDGFSPQDELFDSQLYALQGMAGASYRQSARLSYSFSGAAFQFKRHSRALFSSQGARASGEVNYALSRRTGIGASYGYQYYTFARDTGMSRSTTVMGMFHRVLSPRWQFGLSAGMYQVDSERLQARPADPLIQALTGIRTELGRFRRTNYGLASNVALNGNYGRSHIGIGYTRGVTPGTAIIQTSDRQIGTVGYSYSLRRTSFMTAGSISRYRSLLPSFTDLPVFNVTSWTSGISYRLWPSVHLTGRAQISHSDAGLIRQIRGRYGVSFGVAFSPGELPLMFF